MTRSTRRNRWNRLRAMALAFAAVAVFPAVASAHVRDTSKWERSSAVSPMAQGYVSDVEQELGIIAGDRGTEIPYAAWGVVLDQQERSYQGVAAPDGYQPQLRGSEPLVIRDKPDGFQLRRAGGGEVYVTFGFGLGLLLTAALALGLAVMSGRGIRTAHS